MRFILFLLLFCISTKSKSQSDSIKKVSVISMINIGVLYPEHNFSVYESSSSGYSSFEVSPKLGYNSNLTIGISSKIFKGCNLENLIGVGHSSNSYSKKGDIIRIFGIAGPDTFNGIINEKNTEYSLLLINGLSFYNPNKKKNKIYFSNYISTSLIFDKVTKTETIGDDNKKGTDKIHTKYLKFVLNTIHVLSYEFNLKKYDLKIGTGLNVYFLEYHKGYINPLINLTLKI